METKIRTGTKKDLPAALALINELAEYEKAPHEVTVTLEQFEADGFGQRPFYELFVAEVENRIVGMALFYLAYSTWKGKMIYLDDLIVSEKFRGHGIGRKLFESLVKHCKAHHVKQLRWHVLEWNKAALNFYKKFDSNFDPEWVTCKLNETQIQRFGEGTPFRASKV